MYVEDLLAALATLNSKNKITGSWDKSFIGSVADSRLFSERALSTNQAASVLKIAANYARAISVQLLCHTDEVKAAIAAPKYKYAPYVSSTIRNEVRYAGGNVLVFRFKSYAQLSARFKALTVRAPGAGIHAGRIHHECLWKVEVSAANLEQVMNVIKDEKFDFDEDTLKYITECHNSYDVFTTMVASEGKIYFNVVNSFILANTLRDLLDGEYV